MTALGNLREEVYASLMGFVRVQEQSTYLTAPISDTAVNFAVSDAKPLSRGVIEVGDELMYVDRKDEVADTVTIPPYGRGYLGTTAVAHAAGERVTNNPRFPRNDITKAINRTISAMYPDVTSVKTTTFPFRTAVLRYALPVDADYIVSAEWMVPGPSDVFLPVGRWRADTTATEVRIEVRDTNIVPGQNIRVTYAAKPTALTDLSVAFTDSGFADSAQDIVVYGACSRLLGYTESARLQSESIESSDHNSLVPPGSTLNAGRYFYQLYKQRLAEEQRRQQLRFPIRMHMAR